MKADFWYQYSAFKQKRLQWICHFISTAKSGISAILCGKIENRTVEPAPGVAVLQKGRVMSRV
jgi:hypothetical protein